MNFEKGVVAVGLARQQRFDLPLGPFRLQLLNRLLGLVDDRFVVFHLAKFDQFDIVSKWSVRDAGPTRYGSSRSWRSRMTLLGFFGIVPKIGILGPGVQLVEIIECLIPVKDASSAARWTA